MTRGATTRPAAFERRLRASIALRKAAIEHGKARADRRAGGLCDGRDPQHRQRTARASRRHPRTGADMSGDIRDPLVLMEHTDGWYSVVQSTTLLSPCRESIEGSLTEMVELGHAIETRATYRAKRCAVDATGDGVRLWSPRNSMGNGRLVPRAAGESLSRSIRETAARVAHEIIAGERRSETFGDHDADE